jgi:pimeloyl-ACP methyl ester carboxylesterase
MKVSINLKEASDEEPFRSDSWCMAWGMVLGWGHRGTEEGGPHSGSSHPPGHSPGDDRSKVSFDDYVGKIVSVLKSQPPPAVLVGHSSAGFLLQAAAPKAADKISQLIFLNAFILPNGKSQFDLVPPEASEGMTAAAKASPDKSVPVIEDFVRNMLMAGEPADKQNALISRLVPQPLALFTTPVSTADFERLSVPKTVVFCRNDASLPPGAYLAMADGLGPHSLVELDGSHEALFTNPSAVAGALLNVLKE